MAKFDQSGNIQWSKPNYYALMATADGGVIAQSEYPYSGATAIGLPFYSGPAITFDANGNQTGQMSAFPTRSWTGAGYQLGSINRMAAATINYAAAYNAVSAGNRSGNGAAAKEEWFPDLPSCPLTPPGQPPCAKEAIRNALASLRMTLSGSCTNCSQYVFSILGSTQQQFYKYLLRAPRLFDGSRSNAPANVLCPSGFFNWLFCGEGSETVATFMSTTTSTAVSQTPSDQGEGPMIFFDPSAICRSTPSSQTGILNQSMLFHEALHGYYGLSDLGLKSDFGINTNLPSLYITYYLEDNVLGPGASTCGN